MKLMILSILLVFSIKGEAHDSCYTPAYRESYNCGCSSHWAKRQVDTDSRGRPVYKYEKRIFHSCKKTNYMYDRYHHHKQFNKQYNRRRIYKKRK